LRRNGKTDRGRLERFLDRYLEAVVANDATLLPLTRDGQQHRSLLTAVP
jgi:hypothetical protein